MYCPGIGTVARASNSVGLRRAQDLGDLETVDQRGVAARAVEGQAVQHLQPRRIVAVGAVGVRRQVHVGVGQVGLGEVGSELPEPAEDRLPHVADPPDQIRRCRRGRRCSRHDCEPVRGDRRQPLAHTLIVGHHRVELDLDGVVGDGGRIPQLADCGVAAIRAGCGVRKRRRKATGTSDVPVSDHVRRATPLSVTAEVALRSGGNEAVSSWRCCVTGCIVASS